MSMGNVTGRHQLLMYKTVSSSTPRGKATGQPAANWQGKGQPNANGQHRQQATAIGQGGQTAAQVPTGMMKGTSRPIAGEPWHAQHRAHWQWTALCLAQRAKKQRDNCLSHMLRHLSAYL